MRLEIERQLDAPPERVWPYIAEPERINEWSTAQVEWLSVGERRRVRIPLVGFSVVLEEVIEAAEVPSRLAYRVVKSNFPFQGHQGEIRLEPSASGTQLRWVVEAAFPVPLVGRVARRFLLRELARSLDRLESRL